MKRMLLTTLLTTVAMGAGTAFAQSPECDRLVLFMEQNQGMQMPAGMDMERVRTLQTDRNEAECTTLLQQVAQQGGQPAAQGADSVDANATPEAQEGQAEGGGANITVQQAAPTITVDQAQPQVSVQQAQPNVMVRQPQPEIIVRQPAPVITIDIPQPEIIVRMPQPEVTVEQAQPQVSVQQAQPEVQVVQPEQPQVQVQEQQPAQVAVTQAEGQANIQVEQTGEAQVTYERAEPQVTINQAEGQPTITVEQMEAGAPAAGAEQMEAGAPAAGAEQTDAMAPAAGADQTAEETAAAQQLRDSEDPNATPEVQEGAGDQQAAATQSGQAATATDSGQAMTGEMSRVALADFDGMNVVNERGEDLGEVEGIVQSTADGKQYVVIENGGFLGVGENRIALSLEGLMMQGDNLVVPGLTDDEIRALPVFEASDQYPQVDDAEVEIRTMAAQ